MSDKQRLLDRLTKGRTVNQALLRRLAQQVSNPMAERILVKVTRLRERGEITEEVAKTIEKAVVKAKPQIKTKPSKLRAGIPRRTPYPIKSIRISLS